MNKKKSILMNQELKCNCVYREISFLNGDPTLYIKTSGSTGMNIESPKFTLYRYIMFGRGICEKYQSRHKTFPEPNGEGNLVSRLVFFANTPPKHDISV